MNFQGLILGALSFLIIGIFHPLVIKGEYYFGKRIWPIFLVVGILFIAASLFVDSVYASVLLGLVGFSSLWSINELKDQEERVRKGWFPKNPKRKYDF